MNDLLAVRGPERISYWFIGLLLGVILGLALAVTGVIGLALVLAALVGGWLIRRSVAFESGLLVGIGGTWVGLLARVVLACEEFNSRPGSSCEVPNLAPWMLVSVAVVAVGLLLGWLALRRAGPPPV